MIHHGKTNCLNAFEMVLTLLRTGGFLEDYSFCFAIFESGDFVMR